MLRSVIITIDINQFLNALARGEASHFTASKGLTGYLKTGNCYCCPNITHIDASRGEESASFVAETLVK